MKRAVLTVLATVGVAAGLAVTASSTTTQAYDAGMRGIALAAIVVVLEVTNVLGTWVLLTDPRRHACVEAGALVAGASVVTGWCGVVTYGLIGLVGPVFVLGGVELARLASTSPKVGDEVGSAPLVVPTSPAADLEADLEDEVEDDPAPPLEADPVTDPVPSSPSVRVPHRDMTDEEIADLLRPRPVLPSRDGLKAELGIGTKRASDVLALARRPHLVPTSEVAR